MAQPRQRNSRQAKGKSAPGNGNGAIKTPDIDPELYRELAKRIPTLSNAEIAKLITDMTPLRVEGSTAEEKAQGDRMQQTARAPRNDDELHAWIIEQTGHVIPRVAVCDDHCAPFDYISDAYFNRENALLICSSRESGKTLNISILQYANAETKPGAEGVTFGAVLSQAKRAYRYIKDFIFTRDDDGNRVPKPQIQGDPTRERTEWKTGSSVEVITGTKSGVNSPHCQTVHADEVDLMEDEVWRESRNISSSKILPNGGRIPAVDIATSTRKSTRGLMQEILDEVNEATRNGHKPPWKVYFCCVKEVAEEVPMCRCVDPVSRVRRLIQLGLPPSSTCQCDVTIKGEWGEGQPRTLESVCRGDFFKSRGWMPHDDVVRKFMQNSQAVWEAQMECRRPMADGLYLPTFSRPRHCTRGWVPRPEYGRISMGIDWGGSAASSVGWVQGPLHHPVEVQGFTMKSMIVPQGAYVVFDQIHISGIGATKLADMVVTREIAWRERLPGFRVRGRFADMAGRQQRDDWHEHNPPLRTQWYITRDFDPSVETVQGLMNDNLLYVDVTRCAELADDFESWRMKDGREIHDDSSHGPAMLRYCLANVVVIERRAERQNGKPQALPAVRERGLDGGSGPIASNGDGGVGSSGAVSSERWREAMGILSPTSARGGVNGWRVG